MLIIWKFPNSIACRTK